MAEQIVGKNKNERRLPQQWEIKTTPNEIVFRRKMPPYEFEGYRRLLYQELQDAFFIDEAAGMRMLLGRHDGPCAGVRVYFFYDFKQMNCHVSADRALPESQKVQLETASLRVQALLFR